MSKNDYYYTIEKPMGTQGKSCTQSCQHKGLDGRTTYTPKFGWPFFAPSVSASHPIPPLALLLSSRIWKEIITLYSCSNSSCLQGSPGSLWQFLCCAGLLSALMCVSGSSPLPLLQQKVVCSLCKKRCKEVRVERRGQPSFFFLCLSV